MMVDMMVQWQLLEISTVLVSPAVLPCEATGSCFCRYTLTQFELSKENRKKSKVENVDISTLVALLEKLI